MVPLPWVTSMRIAQLQRIVTPATAHSSSSLNAAAGILGGFRHITTGQPTAQQGTRAEEEDSSGSSTVFTGTAEVHTDKAPQEVATDANRCGRARLRMADKPLTSDLSVAHTHWRTIYVFGIMQAADV